MIIAGIQKVTLVDYPGKVAATIFTRGCSFRCGFCHNPELVLPEKFIPALDNEEIYKFLKSRVGKLEAVCITGGEPMLFSDIGKLIKRIKSIGLLVKLDTNGSFPDRLEKVIEEGNLDYIAMDIKGPLDKYKDIARPIESLPQRGPLSGRAPKGRGNLSLDKNTPINVIPTPFDSLSSLRAVSVEGSFESKIVQSIKLIMDSGTCPERSRRIDYEFRTTVVKPMLSVEDFQGIGQMIRGAKRYIIQNFVKSKHVLEEIKMSPFSDEELEAGKKIMEEYVSKVDIR